MDDFMGFFYALFLCFLVIWFVECEFLKLPDNQ